MIAQKPSNTLHPLKQSQSSQCQPMGQAQSCSTEDPLFPSSLILFMERQRYSQSQLHVNILPRQFEPQRQ